MKALRIEAEQRNTRRQPSTEGAPLSSDASQMLTLVRDIGQELRTACEDVPPELLRSQIGGMAGMFDCLRNMVAGKEHWDMNFVLPALQTTLSNGTALTGQSLEALMAQNGNVSNPRARVGIAMAVLAQAVTAAGSGASGGAAAATSAQVNEAQKCAADHLGNDNAGRTEVLKLGALGTAAARDEAESPALCAAARNAMQGRHGADITLLLSQEKLDTPKGACGLSPNTRTVWQALAAVARQLLLAWGEKWRKLCPAHIMAIVLVEAVLRGKVSVAMLVPARLGAPKTAAAMLEQRDAVMQAWPVLMAVVREVTPSDATAEP